MPRNISLDDVLGALNSGENKLKPKKEESKKDENGTVQIDKHKSINVNVSANKQLSVMGGKSQMSKLSISKYTPKGV